MKKQLMKIKFSLVRIYDSIEKLIYLHKLFFISSKWVQSKWGLKSICHIQYIAFSRHSNYDFLIVEILLTKPRWFLNPLILDYECTVDEKITSLKELMKNK